MSTIQLYKTSCAQTGCQLQVEWTCLFHKIALCYSHWKNHNRICESKGILIEDAQLLVNEQIRDLNTRFNSIKKQLLDLGSKMITSINLSVSKALDNMYEQKKSVMKVILRCIPKDDFEKILNLIPKNLDSEQSNDVLLKLGPSFDVKEFNLKVNNLDAELKLENMKNECRKQGIILFEESLIQEIKISKDSNFVFICKVKTGKNKIVYMVNKK